MVVQVPAVAVWALALIMALYGVLQEERGRGRLSALLIADSEDNERQTRRARRNTVLMAVGVGAYFALGLFLAASK